MNDFYEMKKRLVSCTLLLSMMLTACADRRTYVGNSVVEYDNGKVSGTVSYEEVEKNIKIITFSQDGVVFTKPMIIRNYPMNSGENITEYIEMETGTFLIKFSTHPRTGEASYTVGKNLEILEEKAFVPYLFSEDYIQLKYKMGDLVTFYQEKVEPKLEDNSDLSLD